MISGLSLFHARRTSLAARHVRHLIYVHFLADSGKLDLPEAEKGFARVHRLAVFGTCLATTADSTTVHSASHAAEWKRIAESLVSHHNQAQDTRMIKVSSNIHSLF
jgi:hypothetical protein